ncbi:sensor histidine kinase [Roseiflexus castenholzii]|uniref:sensor histidine kinase n=1 Tax=Roseiflexus castenholzii TaxID=120962 RepID=UPI00235471BB
MSDIRPRSTPPIQTAIYLMLASALYFVAFSLGSGPASTVISMLLFLLVGQSTWTLPLAAALIYAGGMMIGVCGMIACFVGLEVALQSAATLSFGVVFVTMFVRLSQRYEQQTEQAEAQRARAEELLAQLKASHDELRAARERELKMAAIEERVRLARDIHDGLGHYLTILNVQLQAASRLLQRDPERAAAVIATCREVAQTALDEVRRSVAAMQPSPLDGHSLDVAIERLIDDFRLSTAIDVRFVQAGDLPALPQTLAMTLYRAVQEGLTNARKHGNASQIDVTLTFLPETARLTIRDNGQPNNDAHEGSGFGLTGLRERIERLGGVLRAGPLPEGGFLLDIVAPVARANEVHYDPGIAGR